MGKRKTIHVEIVPANWKRLERYIKIYNKNPGRDTPRIKDAHVINEALLYYLSQNTLQAKG